MGSGVPLYTLLMEMLDDAVNSAREVGLEDC